MSGQQVLTRTSYYYHGGVRVALRVTNGTSVLYYLHTDHLGSSYAGHMREQRGLSSFAYKAVVAKRLYRPYGVVRYITGARYQRIMGIPVSARSSELDWSICTRATTTLISNAGSARIRWRRSRGIRRA